MKFWSMNFSSKVGKFLKSCRQVCWFATRRVITCKVRKSCQNLWSQRRVSMLPYPNSNWTVEKHQMQFKIFPFTFKRKFLILRWVKVLQWTNFRAQNCLQSLTRSRKKGISQIWVKSNKWSRNSQFNFFSCRVISKIFLNLKSVALISNLRQFRWQ